MKCNGLKQCNVIVIVQDPISSNTISDIVTSGIMSYHTKRLLFHCILGNSIPFALYYTELQCIVLHCIVLYYIALYYIVLYYIALYYIALYYIALYYIALYCITLYCITLH